MFCDKTQPLSNPQADGRPITVLLLVCKYASQAVWYRQINTFDGRIIDEEGRGSGF